LPSKCLISQSEISDRRQRRLSPTSPSAQTSTCTRVGYAHSYRRFCMLSQKSPLDPPLLRGAEPLLSPFGKGQGGFSACFGCNAAEAPSLARPASAARRALLPKHLQDSSLFPQASVVRSARLRHCVTEVILGIPAAI